jgi:UDP-glucose 4-epimerase
MMATFLVTGGAGYIGSHMAHLLVDQGYQVIVIDNLSTGFKKLVPEKAELFEVDMGDSTKVTEILRQYRPEAVFHFAAFIRVEESVAEPFKYYENNTLKAAKFIRACANEGVKNFVFSSTAAVYGSPKTELVTESADVKPESPYGHSKAMTEQILKDVASTCDMKFTILRYFNVAGARPDLKTGQISKNATHLIKVACEVATGKRPKMMIFGTDYPTYDGTCVRDYIHVQDLVAAHLDAYNYMTKKSESGTFNLGYGRGFSVKEVIEVFQKTNQVKIPHDIGPRRPGDAVQIVADSGRAKIMLGWQPKFDSLETICRTAFDWEKSSFSTY